LVASGQVVAGEFTPTAAARQFCGATMLRTIRRRSLAALRREVEPVPQATVARFLPEWQGVGGSRRSRGVDGLARVVEQLAGALVPASALETLVLPARVSDYTPALLDELTSSGEVLWCGHGSLARNDGWVCLLPSDAAELLPEVTAEELSPLHEAVLHALDGGQALFFRALHERVVAEAEHVEGLDSGEAAVSAALWDLVWSGRLTNDTLSPIRGRLGGGRTTHQRRAAAPRARYGRFSRPGAARLPAGSAARSGAALTGRWSALPPRQHDGTRAALLRTEVLLDRYGILTRGAVAAEGVPGGFSAVYPVLRQAEETGRYRRGYFVDGLGAAQFGVSGAVDRLRNLSSSPPEVPDALVLAATDPANPYGAALGWPDRHVEAEDGRRGHQPARKAGALVVLVDGALVLYVERGGRTLLSFTDDPAALRHAADALSVSVRNGALGRLHVETADGERVASSVLGEALELAGFRPSPRGLQLRA
jgi:ATP-dependent Lhr-like helicase